MKLIQTSPALTDHFPDSGKMVMPTRAANHFVGVSKMVGGAPQSQRGCIHQPRVARNELPWVNGKRNFQPQRGCILLAPMGCNPFRVEDVCFTISQGSSSLATLGYMLESLWDSPTDAKRVRDLEQTIAGNVAEILEA
jgi:hypothetical protein